MKNSKAAVKVMQPKLEEGAGEIAPLMKQVLEHLGRVRRKDRPGGRFRPQLLRYD